jgi:hypothetical protein
MRENQDSQFIQLCIMLHICMFAAFILFFFDTSNRDSWDPTWQTCDNMSNNYCPVKSVQPMDVCQMAMLSYYPERTSEVAEDRRLWTGKSTFGRVIPLLGKDFQI